MSSRCYPVRRVLSRSPVYGLAIGRIGGTCHGLRWSSTFATRHDPLRILFCGADEFSIYSLRALHALQQQEPGTVKSIDVVCRPDKRTGRGLKTIRQVPIKPIASELGLPLHQINTFTGWAPPSSVDLIVTVSFGLLVPSRLLNAATYGGINVHPSLLPDLKGPAPIQHALLQQRFYTGTSVQTMHPKTFDAGVVLAQTPRPGLIIPRPSTVDEMVEKLGPQGADMLVQTIQTGLFIPPLTPVNTSMPSYPDKLSHAPKITPEDRHINWSTWDAPNFALRDRVLGRLWDDTIHSHIEPQLAGTRTTFHRPWRIVQLPEIGAPSLKSGAPFLFSKDDKEDPRLGIMCANGRAVSPASATIAGGKAGQGVASLIRQLREAEHEVHRAESVPLDSLV